MKLYKLTNEKGQTHNETQWGEGITHRSHGKDDQLCSNGYIHAYEHPLLAVLLNPIHANFRNPQLWEAKGRVSKRDGQLKCGCRSLTTIKQISLPNISTNVRVRFAIYCALDVYQEPSFKKWAEDWLSGKNRSKDKATTAARAARAAARATWAAARWAAARAARAAATWAAAREARAAARATWAAARWAAARATWAAEAAARAAAAEAEAAAAETEAAAGAAAAEAESAAAGAEAAARAEAAEAPAAARAAAEAAARATWAAAWARKSIDLIKLIEKAVREEREYEQRV